MIFVGAKWAREFHAPNEESKIVLRNIFHFLDWMQNDLAKTENEINHDDEDDDIRIRLLPKNNNNLCIESTMICDTCWRLWGISPALNRHWSIFCQRERHPRHSSIHNTAIITLATHSADFETLYKTTVTNTEPGSTPKWRQFFFQCRKLFFFQRRPSYFSI